MDGIDQLISDHKVLRQRLAAESKAVVGEIEDFAKRRGLSPLYICAKATGNGKILQRVTNGGSLSPATILKVRQFIKDELAKDALQ